MTIVIVAALMLAIAPSPTQASHVTEAITPVCVYSPTTGQTCADTPELPPIELPPTACVEPFGCKDLTHPTLPTPDPVPIDPIEWEWNKCVPPINVRTVDPAPVGIDAGGLGGATVDLPGTPSIWTSPVCAGLYPYPDPTPSNAFCVPDSMNIPQVIDWPEEILPPIQMPGPPPACVSPVPISIAPIHIPPVCLDCVNVPPCCGACIECPINGLLEVVDPIAINPPELAPINLPEAP